MTNVPPAPTERSPLREGRFVVQAGDFRVVARVGQPLLPKEEDDDEGDLPAGGE